MNKEEIEEIETLEIDFKDTDELELALEVSSKKAIYLIDDLIKHLFELQQENIHLKEHIEKYEHYCKTTGIEELMKENEQLKEENKMLRNIQIHKQDDDLIIFVGEECKRFKINTNELLWIKEIGEDNE